MPPALFRSIVYTEFFKQVAELNVSVRAPDQFQLVENFRTHSGIVNLAHSVVAALTHFFPDSVDKLQPETSRISGEGRLGVLLKLGSVCTAWQLRSRASSFNPVDKLQPETSLISGEEI